MGFAMLAKGPVGALLPGTAMVLFLVMERRFNDLRAIAQPPGSRCIATPGPIPGALPRDT